MIRLLIGVLLFFVIISVLHNVLPDIPSDVLVSITTWFGYLKGLNDYLPIIEIISLFTFVIVVEGVMLGVRIILWIGSLLGNSNTIDRGGSRSSSEN